MSKRWQYGAYTFTINPSSYDATFNVIGDEVRTLSGALISQPTTVAKSYDIGATFYQPRTKVISEVAIASSTVAIEYFNNSVYLLNTAGDKIDIFNSNYVFQSSIALTALSVKTYARFDVTSSGVWIATNGTSDDTIYKVSDTGTLLSTKTIAKKDDPIIGIQEVNSFLYILNASTIDIYALPSVVKIDTITMQSIGYNGMSSCDNRYLILGNKDTAGNNIVYHVDTYTGKIVNGLTSDSILLIEDVTYNNGYFYSFNASNKSIQKILGNTVALDIYNLEQEIKGTNFVALIDDMGIEKRVRTSGFRKERLDKYESAYTVSISVEEINRGL